MALSHHSLLHGEVPYGEVHLQGPFEGQLGVRVSLYMDGLRAANPQGSGGHQDVPASRQTQEHALGGGVLKWGKQQLRGRVIYRESCRQRRSALRFPDSQWLSMGKRGPQEE